MRQVLGGCQSRRGRLLSVRNATEAGGYGQEETSWAIGGGGGGTPPPRPNTSLGAHSLEGVDGLEHLRHFGGDAVPVPLRQLRAELLQELVRVPPQRQRPQQCLVGGGVPPPTAGQVRGEHPVPRGGGVGVRPRDGGVGDDGGQAVQEGLELALVHLPAGQWGGGMTGGRAWAMRALCTCTRGSRGSDCAAREGKVPGAP